MLSSGLSGAISGAAIGSIIPGIGTAVGAAIGGGLGVLQGATQAAGSRDEAAEVLAALDIMTGDENGDLHLSSPVTRAEFVKMLMAASPISVGDVTYVSPYPDVPASHWAAPYVEAAVSAGYVTGYLDGTFRPPEPKPETDVPQSGNGPGVQAAEGELPDLNEISDSGKSRQRADIAYEEPLAQPE